MSIHSIVVYEHIEYSTPSPVNALLILIGVCVWCCQICGKLTCTSFLFMFEPIDENESCGRLCVDLHDVVECTSESPEKDETQQQDVETSNADEVSVLKLRLKPYYFNRFEFGHLPSQTPMKKSDWGEILCFEAKKFM